MKDLKYYMDLNYKIEMRKDDLGKGYTLSIPDLKGCSVFADNAERGMDLLNNLKSQWIKVALEDGDFIPEPSPIDGYSGQFKLRLPKSLHMALTELSKNEGISLNQYCLYLLSRNLNYNAKRDKFRNDVRIP